MPRGLTAVSISSVRRAKPLARRGELTLRRVFPDGRVYDLWSVTSSAMTAAVVRAAKRTLVAWPEGSALRFITRPDGGIPTHPHTVPLRLSGTHSLAAVLDRDGRLVAAMTSPRGLVLASISLNGGVRHRQSFAGVDGYVSVETDSLGRVSALIYDSGISVGDGECISEGRVPMVRARSEAPTRSSSSPSACSPRRRSTASEATRCCAR